MSKFDENMSEIFDADTTDKKIEQLPIIQEEPNLIEPKGVEASLTRRFDERL
jgi:hypothetical protein